MISREHILSKSRSLIRPILASAAIFLTACAAEETSISTESNDAPDVRYIHLGLDNDAKDAVDVLNSFLKDNPSKRITSLAGIAMSRQDGLAGIVVTTDNKSNHGERCGSVNVAAYEDDGRGGIAQAQIQEWLDSHPHSKITAMTSVPGTEGGGAGDYVICAQ